MREQSSGSIAITTVQPLTRLPAADSWQGTSRNRQQPRRYLSAAYSRVAVHTNVLYLDIALWLSLLLALSLLSTRQLWDSGCAAVRLWQWYTRLRLECDRGLPTVLQSRQATPLLEDSSAAEQHCERSPGSRTTMSSPGPGIPSEAVVPAILVLIYSFICLGASCLLFGMLQRHGERWNCTLYRRPSLVL